MAADDNSQSSRMRDGLSSNVSGHGNVSQSVHVAAHKPGLVVPLLAALVSAVAGAYATHQFALLRAPERTVDQTETVLGIARSAIDLAKSTQASPQVIAKLEELASQAQAVQANAQLLQSPTGAAALQADFWLSMHKGAVLGNTSSFGVNYQWGPGHIRVRLNDKEQQMMAGVRLPYTNSSKKACHVIYVGPSPDSKLHGFKTTCEP